MSTISKLKVPCSSESAMAWIIKYTRLWNTEFRMSFDQETLQYVAELVYSDSSCVEAKSNVPAYAVSILIDKLGGFDG
jgi:hypothetical protein